MRVLGISSVFLLTACILSFSLTGAVNAQTDQVPLSVETDYPGYADGTQVNISGKVRDSSLLKNPTPIVLMVLNPDGGIVTIAQTNLDSDNKYSVSMVAGGPLWKATGEYTVKAQYGAQKGETTFTFTGGAVGTPEPEVVVPEPVEVVVEEPVAVVVEEPVAVVVAEPEPEPEPEQEPI